MIATTDRRTSADPSSRNDMSSRSTSSPGCVANPSSSSRRFPGFSSWIFRRASSRFRTASLSPTLHLGEEMSQLFFLGLEVLPRRVRGRNLDRNALDDLQPVSLHRDELAGVVGQKAQARHPDRTQDLRPDPVVALVRLETKMLIGLDRIDTLVLQVIGLDLVGEPDPTPFLAHVQDYPAPFGPDHLHRLPE